MEEEKWIKEITIDMLPKPYDFYAEIIGIDGLYKLSKASGGTTLYIPKPESIFREFRNKKIKEDFTGYNYRELALKYNLCERAIRDILNGVVPTLPGQVSLFDT